MIRAALLTNLRQLTTILTTIIIVAISPLSLLTVPTTAYQTLLSPEERAEIYRLYNVDIDEAPECPSNDDLLSELCPIDNGAISVGRIEKITQFCTHNVPTDDDNEHEHAALEGCKRFVACYIVRNRQKIPNSYACCPSELCNLFLGEQYVKMGVLWDDDDDDQFPEEDDGGLYDDGVVAREEAAVSADL